MKKLIFPVVLVVTAAGGAFATQTGTAKDAALVPAYRVDPDSGLCVAAGQQCDTMGNIVCRWSVDGITPLHAAPVSPTQCGKELFKP